MKSLGEDTALYPLLDIAYKAEAEAQAEALLGQIK